MVSAATAAAKLLQSCPTLCDPIDSSPPGSPIPGILQVRVLEWIAISFSNAWKWKVKVKSLSRVRLFATPWTVAYQAPPSMDFPGKRTGVGCHCLLRTLCWPLLNCQVWREWDVDIFAYISMLVSTDCWRLLFSNNIIIQVSAHIVYTPK